MHLFGSGTRETLCDQFGAFCLLLSAYCFLPTAFCLLLSAYCFLPSAFCLLLSAYCFLPSAFCLLLADFYSFLSTGNPAFCQAAKPPSSAAALSIPFALRSTTARADVCSLGQEQ